MSYHGIIIISVAKYILNPTQDNKDSALPILQAVVCVGLRKSRASFSCIIY